MKEIIINPTVPVNPEDLLWLFTDSARQNVCGRTGHSSSMAETIMGIVTLNRAMFSEEAKKELRDLSSDAFLYEKLAFDCE